MASQQLSFVSRIALAWSSYFRVLFDPAWAKRVQELSTPPRLPEMPGEPTSPPRSPTAAPPPAAAPEPAERDLGPAMQLLGLLQREGRLVDFLQQDIATFSDAQIGAASRVVHSGCRRALNRIATLRHLREEPEGTEVTLSEGFDPKAIKLLGNVQGAPPYRGTLRHGGWKVERFELEDVSEPASLNIVAQAEVEL